MNAVSLLNHFFYSNESTIYNNNVNNGFVVQGDRFGGALDAAAKQFSTAYDSGLIPHDFVNKMRAEHKLIIGIGHRVKSVSSVKGTGSNR